MFFWPPFKCDLFIAFVLKIGDFHLLFHLINFLFRKWRENLEKIFSIKLFVLQKVIFLYNSAMQNLTKIRTLVFIKISDIQRIDYFNEFSSFSIIFQDFFNFLFDSFAINFKKLSLTKILFLLKIGNSSLSSPWISRIIFLLRQWIPECFIPEIFTFSKNKEALSKFLQTTWRIGGSHLNLINFVFKNFPWANFF